MRALVTGAGGFIGANLVRYLLAGGHEPLALERPGGNTWRLDDVRSDVAEFGIDLRDHESLTRFVSAERPEVIFHLAAHGAYSWQTDFDAMLQVNVLATQHLLDCARDVGATFVQAGTSSEYGYQDHPPREDEVVRPNSHYAVTKVAATHLCGLAATVSDVRAVTLRLYSIYGMWEEPGRLMPTLVRRAMAGEWPPLVGPETARDFVFVDDACEAFIRAALLNTNGTGEVLNIASGTQTSLQALTEVAREVLRVAAEPVWGTMAARAWDTSTWVGDPTAARLRLQWQATTDLREGLSRTAAWFGEHPELAARYAS